MSDCKIFFIATEEKERYVLGNLLEPLQRRGYETIFIDNFLKDILRGNHSDLVRFVTQELAVLITSQTTARTLAELIRPRDTFLSIGIEHGIAPFKSYTYRPALLESNYYLAPTELWHDRLISLFPEAAQRVRLGGYGRISEIKDLRGQAGNLMKVPSRYERWHATSKRKLVIFSWGVNGNALESLPDSEDIVYLLHPADVDLYQSISFQHAVPVISTPEDCAYLLAQARFVFGDFSSLTLEAHALELPVIFFLDRSLYSSDCDLDPGFFDPTSPAYAKIPETEFRIPPKCIIGSKQLSHALLADTLHSDILRHERNANKLSVTSFEGEDFVPLEVPESLLPPSGDNREITAEAIIQIIQEDPLLRRGGKLERSRHHLDCAALVAQAYQDVLGRSPDLYGFIHNTEALLKSDAPLMTRALSLWAAMSQSPEGKTRFAEGVWRPPFLSLSRF